MMTALFSANASLGIGAGSDPSLGPQSGPQFTTPTAVATCFKQIIYSFPHSTFTPFPTASKAIFCSSTDGTFNTIIVQATLTTGRHAEQWFPWGSGGYSKPLSDIEPDGNQSANVPACAVFTFDLQSPIATNQYKILNLAIYMDRWQMAADLWPGTVAGKKTLRHFPTP